MRIISGWFAVIAIVLLLVTATIVGNNKTAKHTLWIIAIAVAAIALYNQVSE